MGFEPTTLDLVASYDSMTSDLIKFVTELSKLPNRLILESDIELSLQQAMLEKLAIGKMLPERKALAPGFSPMRNCFERKIIKRFDSAKELTSICCSEQLKLLLLLTLLLLVLLLLLLTLLLPMTLLLLVLLLWLLKLLHLVSFLVGPIIQKMIFKTLCFESNNTIQIFSGDFMMVWQLHS